MPRDTDGPAELDEDYLTHAGVRFHKSLLEQGRFSPGNVVRWLHVSASQTCKNVTIVTRLTVAKAALHVIKSGWTDLASEDNLSSAYWTKVFQEIYGEAPAGDKDARWNYLFDSHQKGPPTFEVSRRIREHVRRRKALRDSWKARYK